ncbi:phosphopeptide-binding protein [Neolewinella litorea]|uniref:Phosphopeptide-binding protein n=1 Tax=Neolewinella litorea TaxID=2562452 RepID=A0A4S4NSV7_9BACT|nr:phosphopeptide-binding protein [Neolewinella litorea]THH41551.1 phosphopeptide-binding protein [Neolewinella litorea]
MKILNTFLLISLLGIFACGGDTQEDNMDQGGVTEEGSDMIGDGNPGNENIQLTDMPPTEGFPNASIDDWKYEKGTFNYQVSGYTFGKITDDAEQLMCANSDQGQHVHLIIDNEPYIAKYEPTFDQPIADGEHYILTFLSRSYHESIKTPAAHRVVKANVSDGSFTSSQEVTEPMLFYSRPKGTYVGRAETENVMLDFYPVNVTLGGEYTVMANVNGKEFTIDEWKPYYLHNLPMGENTVTLTLMRGDSIVDAPLNPVRRTFTLEANPAEEASR